MFNRFLMAVRILFHTESCALWLLNKTRIRQHLKNTLKPHLHDYWAIPAEDEGQFAYYMEDVLELYHEPYDQNCPVICFDETSKALRGHKRDSLPAQPGAVARIDTHYERNGKRNLHLATEPLTGWVTVAITENGKTNASVLIAESTTQRPSGRRSLRGKSSEMLLTNSSIGSSRPTMHAPSYAGSILFRLQRASQNRVEATLRTGPFNEG